MGEMRGKVAAMVALAAVSISIGLFMGRSPLPLPPEHEDEVAGAPAPAPSTVAVHISGMVLAPGVVHVPVDAIVADAIEAAGGLLPGALVDQINLAAPVAPGAQVVVPGPTDPGSETSSADGPISLNQASAMELETLPGVGPVLAGRIVSHRETNGRFAVVEDLLEVPGIGEAKLNAIRDLVRP